MTAIVGAGGSRQTSHALLGSAVGEDCFIGAGLVFGAGQVLPAKTRIVGRLIDAKALRGGQTYLWTGERAFRVPSVLLKGP